MKVIQVYIIFQRRVHRPKKKTKKNPTFDSIVTMIGSEFCELFYPNMDIDNAKIII